MGNANLWPEKSVRCLSLYSISGSLAGRHMLAVFQCLTGGKKGGVHVTDVTNASRTMLFNIHTMDWDPDLCK